MKENCYTVYYHKFPNNKYYIGLTKQNVKVQQRNKITINTYANQQPSQLNPVKVDWKVQRLTLEDGYQ